MVGSGASLLEGYEVLTPDFPAAASFAGFVNNLPIAEGPVEPLYLRAPDAKPSTTAHTVVRTFTPDDLEAMADIHALSFAKGWTAESLACLI